MATTYAPSQEVAVHNALVSTLAALECPDRLAVDRTPLGEGSLLISENQASYTRFPVSVTACPISEEWAPSRNCHEVSSRVRWVWDVRVNFDQPVLTDRALKLLAQSPVTANMEGLVLRLTRVEHTFRPLSAPEQGTSLRLTFESISNR